MSNAMITIFLHLNRVFAQSLGKLKYRIEKSLLISPFYYRFYAGKYRCATNRRFSCSVIARVRQKRPLSVAAIGVRYNLNRGHHRGLPLRLSKRQSLPPKTVLFRNTPTYRITLLNKHISNMMAIK